MAWLHAVAHATAGALLEAVARIAAFSPLGARQLGADVGHLSWSKKPKEAHETNVGRPFSQPPVRPPAAPEARPPARAGPLDTRGGPSPLGCRMGATYALRSGARPRSPVSLPRVSRCRLPCQHPLGRPRAAAAATARTARGVARVRTERAARQGPRHHGAAERPRHRHRRQARRAAELTGAVRSGVLQVLGAEGLSGRVLLRLRLELGGCWSVVVLG